MVKEFCPTCGGKHEPDPPDSWVDFKGYRFRKPFKCMCCGKEICALQFSFGRCCGPCDLGACQLGNRAFRSSAFHPPPPWGTYYGLESFLKFVEYTKATPSPEEKASV